MSDKKQKQPMTASDYIKSQPHLQGKPLTTQNTFSALADFPPLSYSKAVAPSATATSSTPVTQTPTQKSEYFLKPNKQHLLTTQFIKPVTLRELQNFVQRIFYEDSLYPTDNITKNRTFYEYILVDSKSAEITHYPEKTNPNKIAYSTCKILRIQTPQDLGFTHIHTTKPFSTPGYHIQGYTYMDYQLAFFRAFYLRAFDHSWFISLNIHCPKTVPGWFCEWWYWFGPTDQIYPTEITKTSLPFYLKHIPNQKLGPFNKIAFHIDMGIPWICSWHFNLTIALQDMPYSLVKEYRVKWWDKYNLDRCSLTNISNHFQFLKQAQTTIQSVSKSIPLLTPKQLIAAYGSDPKAPTQQKPTPTPASPAHSTGSSSSKSRKREKLKKIFANLVQELETSDDEDEDMQDSDQFGGPLAQDPFE